jgi:tRNA (cytidine/uridine-2'-O-)-methyltransferase
MTLNSLAIALYEPEIPHNTGTLIRLGACLNLTIHVIEPTGFLWGHSHLRRSGLDYHDLCRIKRHESWSEFIQAESHSRMVLSDVRGEIPYYDFQFHSTDILLMGRETSGFPTSLFYQISNRIHIPMCAPARSINLALAASLIIGEAIRQTVWK